VYPHLPRERLPSTLLPASERTRQAERPCHPRETSQWACEASDSDRHRDSCNASLHLSRGQAAFLLTRRRRPEGLRTALHLALALRRALLLPPTRPSPPHIMVVPDLDGRRRHSER
jgi:hypothetical protein